MKKIYYFTAITLLLGACAGEPTDVIKDPIHPEPPLKIVSPKNDEQFIIGDPLEIEIAIKDPSKVNDIELYIDDTLYQTDIKSENQKLTIATTNSKVGFVKFFVLYTDEKGEKRRDTRTVVFFSDVVPEQKTASIISSFPHNKSSYTQGLEFYKGKLFEGTGQPGQSILAEVDLKTGNHIRKHDLESRYFGEGITIINDTIYQLTWSEKTCFVYDMNFNEIKQFSYDGEGWGLCNNGEQLIMSNGTSEIVWRNRHTFEIVKRIYVFSDQQDSAGLNELELINGNLFINVYTENRIIEVDTATGKVLADINCENVVKDGRVPGADVLNGIAHNPVTGKIYLTGKWWPKIYEVTFE